MMLYPSIDRLMKKVDSKYTLVAAAAKRARYLQEEQGEKTESPQTEKYVSVALTEIATGKIDIVTREGQQQTEK